MNAMDDSTAQGPTGGGYAPRGGTTGVLPNDVASMSLVMIDGNDHSVSVNMGGEALVQRGATFTNIGANRNGGGAVMASWDEVVTGNNVYINAIFKSADGSMLLPPTSTVNGQPAFFWSWHMGVTNPVNYLGWVTQVGLTSARIYFSADGGQSFTGNADISAGLGGSFMNGRDNGQYLASIGDGTNYVMLRYQIQVVPAPAGAAALGAAGLLVARRRRR